MIVYKLLILARNAWNLITVCKQIIIIKVNSNLKPYNCVQIINICKEYLKLYNCGKQVMTIVESNNYLKSNNCKKKKTKFGIK